MDEAPARVGTLAVKPFEKSGGFFDVLTFLRVCGIMRKIVEFGGFGMKKVLFSVFSIILVLVLTACSSSSKSNKTTKDLLYGKLLNRTETDDTLVIKAKITPSYNNEATINQNYYNVEHIIKNKGGENFTEIQYWAVADMSDGTEQKVVSFTVSKYVINMIAKGDIAANQMGNLVDDLFIHASLR